MADLNERSTPALMGDLVTHVTELVRKEITLLRAEMNDKATQVAIALGSIVAAVVFVLTFVQAWTGSYAPLAVHVPGAIVLTVGSVWVAAWVWMVVGRIPA